MSRQTALAVAVAPAPESDAGAVDALRQRLAAKSAREHVILDFLDEELRDARVALSGVAAWLANVESALSGEAPTQQQMLGLALGGVPLERVDELANAVVSVRRRLAQVAARM
jgi:hypothetical protein